MKYTLSTEIRMITIYSCGLNKSFGSKFQESWRIKCLKYWEYNNWNEYGNGNIRCFLIRKYLAFDRTTRLKFITIFLLMTATGLEKPICLKCCFVFSSIDRQGSKWKSGWLQVYYFQICARGMIIVFVFCLPEGWKILSSRNSEVYLQRAKLKIDYFVPVSLWTRIQE